MTSCRLSSRHETENNPAGDRKSVFRNCGRNHGADVSADLYAFFSSASQVAAHNGLAAPVNFTVPLSVLIAGIFLGCLLFMWSIRRGRDT